MHTFLKKILILVLFFLSPLTQKTDVLNANVLKKIKLWNPLLIKKYKIPFQLDACNEGSDDVRAQKLCEYTNKLSKELRIKTPEVFIFHAKNSAHEYNAFATYLKKPIVAFGNLLTQRWQEGWFTDEEIEAVIAHELCHIKYHHMLKAGILNLILTGPLLISKITVPVPSPKELAKCAYSRKNEREADIKAIRVLDDPINLLTALIKLQCLGTKTSETKEDFDLNYQITQDELIEEKENFISPLIELLSSHPLTSKRMTYITKKSHK